MTGGTVVVLGDTGRNFAAGMSGGIAYVYDPNGAFPAKCNMAMVALESLQAHDEQSKGERATWHSTTRGGEAQTDEAILKSLIGRHFKYTGSSRARALLDAWSGARTSCVKVSPSASKRALVAMHGRKFDAAANTTGTA